MHKFCFAQEKSSEWSILTLKKSIILHFFSSFLWCKNFFKEFFKKNFSVAKLKNQRASQKWLRYGPIGGSKNFFLIFIGNQKENGVFCKKNLLKNHRKMKSSEFFKKRLKFAICKNTFVLRFYLLQSGVEAEITTPIDFLVKKLTFLSFAPIKIVRGIWCNAKYLISRAVASGPLSVQQRTSQKLLVLKIHLRHF